MGAPPEPSINPAGRLTPTMSSRKLLALDFIKRYFAEWGYSPTLGEVAAGLGVSTKRAHDLVHQLAVAEMIEHITGRPRGIRLLERGAELSEADVLLLLAARGWTIAHGEIAILPPARAGSPLRPCSGQALTEKGLPELPELDHNPGESGISGTGYNDSQAQAAGARPAQRRPARKRSAG